MMKSSQCNSNIISTMMGYSTQNQLISKQQADVASRWSRPFAWPCTLCSCGHPCCPLPMCDPGVSPAQHVETPCESDPGKPSSTRFVESTNRHMPFPIVFVLHVDVSLPILVPLVIATNSTFSPRDCIATRAPSVSGAIRA